MPGDTLAWRAMRSSCRRDKVKDAAVLGWSRYSVVAASCKPVAVASTEVTRPGWARGYLADTTARVCGHQKTQTTQSKGLQGWATPCTCTNARPRSAGQAGKWLALSCGWVSTATHLFSREVWDPVEGKAAAQQLRVQIVLLGGGRQAQAHNTKGGVHTAESGARVWSRADDTVCIHPMGCHRTVIRGGRHQP